MNVDEEEVEEGKDWREGIGRERIVERDEEIVIRIEGGDFRVGIRIKIRVDKKRERRKIEGGEGEGWKNLKIRIGLEVEKVNERLKRKINLERGIEEEGK